MALCCARLRQIRWRWLADRILRCLATTALVLGVLGCESPGATTTTSSTPAGHNSPTPSVQAATQVKLFAPIGPQGLNAGLTASQTLTGTCFGGSAKDPGRSDAWRCSPDSTIYDPCFTDPSNPGSLACAINPWSASVVMLQLSRPLPTQFQNSDATGTALPWALELTNGQHCLILGGATVTIAGMRLNYGCPAGSVAGDPDRTASFWKVFYQAGSASQLSQVNVAVAWY
jgi:hypothetical protein